MFYVPCCAGCSDLAGQGNAKWRGYSLFFVPQCQCSCVKGSSNWTLKWNLKVHLNEEPGQWMGLPPSRELKLCFLFACKRSPALAGPALLGAVLQTELGPARRLTRVAVSSSVSYGQCLLTGTCRSSSSPVCRELLPQRAAPAGALSQLNVLAILFASSKAIGPQELQTRLHWITLGVIIIS